MKATQYVLAIVIALLMALSPQESVARTQPVYNIVDRPVITGTGKSISMERVGQILAASATAKGWSVAKVEDGYLRAQIDVRRHFAAIDIRYSADSYSITYRDSRVLKYDGTKIHRNYNKWIKHIEQLVSANLATE